MRLYTVLLEIVLIYFIRFLSLGGSWTAKKGISGFLGKNNRKKYRKIMKHVHVFFIRTKYIRT